MFDRVLVRRRRAVSAALLSSSCRRPPIFDCIFEGVIHCMYALPGSCLRGGYIVFLGCYNGELLVEMLMLGLVPSLSRFLLCDSSVEWLKVARDYIVSTASCCYLVLDEDGVPVANGAVDLLISAIPFHNMNDPLLFLRDVFRTMSHGGYVFFVCFGSKTLSEFRESLIHAELKFGNIVAIRFARFFVPEEFITILGNIGFEDIVLDVDVLKFGYADLWRLHDDLRILGETSPVASDFGNGNISLSREVLDAAESYYLNRFSNANGEIMATFEVMFVRCKKG